MHHILHPCTSLRVKSSEKESRRKSIMTLKLEVATKFNPGSDLCKIQTVAKRAWVKIRKISFPYSRFGPGFHPYASYSHPFHSTCLHLRLAKVMVGVYARLIERSAFSVVQLSKVEHTYEVAQRQVPVETWNISPPTFGILVPHIPLTACYACPIHRRSVCPAPPICISNLCPGRSSRSCCQVHSWTTSGGSVNRGLINPNPSKRQTYYYCPAPGYTCEYYYCCPNVNYRYCRGESWLLDPGHPDSLIWHTNLISIGGTCCWPGYYCVLCSNGVIGCCPNGRPCYGPVGDPTSYYHTSTSTSTSTYVHRQLVLVAHHDFSITQLGTFPFITIADHPTTNTKPITKPTTYHPDPNPDASTPSILTPTTPAFT